jgi:hypothetical protein
MQFYPWSPVSDIASPETEPKKPVHDRLRLARYFQPLLASGEVETWAESARFLGVSSARITQVLNRLKTGR